MLFSYRDIVVVLIVLTVSFQLSILQWETVSTPSLKEAFLLPSVSRLKNSTLTSTQESSTTIAITSIPNHFVDMGNAIALPFSPWPSTNNNTQQQKYSWCWMEHRAPENSGLLFHKLFKTGSSTAAAVNMRIAKEVGARKFNVTFITSRTRKRIVPRHCAHQFTHLFGLQNRQKDRITSFSFLWTVIRHPATRSLSAFMFYKLGLKDRSAFTDQELIEYLQASKHAQFTQLRDDKSKVAIWAKQGIPQMDGGLDHKSLERNLTLAAEYVQTQVLEPYNFVAVLERWDESLAVLQLLLDLDEFDTIVLSAKSAGRWSWDWTNLYKPRCFHIPRTPILNKTVQRYLSSKFTQGNIDYLLYTAANRSLDLTIDALGKERVQAVLSRHRMLQDLVDRQCQSKAIFPCSHNGTWQPLAERNCYWRDMGCGYECVDRVLHAFRQQEENDLT